MRAILKEQHCLDVQFLTELLVQGVGVDVTTKVWYGAYGLYQCSCQKFWNERHPT